MMLGLAATVAYATPALLPLNPAAASGGGGEKGFLGSIFGGEGNEAGAGALYVGDQLTRKECGDCHEPYAPGNLPDGSWRNIMNNLSNHFGEDASLDDKTRRSITGYLTANAGGRGDAGLRITKTSWFVRKHREVSSRMMVRANIKTMSKCSACHGKNR